MSFVSTGARTAGFGPRRQKSQHHIIIAKGDTVRSYAYRPRLIAFAILLLVVLVGGGAAFGVHTMLQQQMALELQQQSEGAAAVRGSLQQSYEVRIAEMSRQIDSLLSRQLVERSTIEEQIDALAERQNALNQRQQLLTGLTNEAIQAGIDVLPALAPIPPPNPTRLPADETAANAPIDPIVTGATNGPAPVHVAVADVLSPLDGFDPATQLDAVAGALAVVEYDQFAALDAIASAVETRSDTIANGLSALGYRSPAGAVGGPFVAAARDHQDLNQVAGEIQAFKDLVRYARALPLGLPVDNLNITSGYGVRRDPFLGQSAMHTGIDFGVYSGTAVHATGPGRVTFAGTNGGYGKMVEIDHGNGITTRYAHLSSISVRVGQDVARGATIARSGSTGRSTGPHLHYEIIRSGRTIDPMQHIRTGPTIAALL
ncbi:MAG: M23 family metallopeptidase [Bauldia sp.]|nr:M23 family metallopeptidase [Bauldia sp.]